MNAVYWFRMSWTTLLIGISYILTHASILLHFQVCTRFVDGSTSDWVRFLSASIDGWRAKVVSASGAQVVFRSFIHPFFARFFSQSGSTAANLRSQADQATKPHGL